MTILSIVVPVYNEENALPDFLDQLLKAKRALFLKTDCSDIEIIIVNDGSTDNSALIISKYPTIKLINHYACLGYGKALKTGISNAKGDLIAILDADMTYPPEYFIPMIERQKKTQCDIVVGSRLMKGKQESFTPARYAGNRFFALIGSLATGKSISDSASGMRLFKTSLAPFLLTLPDGLDYTFAMTIKAHHIGLKVEEIQIPYHNRVGKSKLAVVKDGLKFSRTLLFMTYLEKPIRGFLFVGLLLIGLSLFLSYRPIIFYLQERRVPDYFFYRFMAVLVSFITGLNGILIGFFSQKIIKVKGIRRFFLGNLIGSILICIGILLNLPGLHQYLTTGSVSSALIFPIAGAISILSGFQIVFTSIFFRLLLTIDRKENPPK